MQKGETAMGDSGKKDKGKKEQKKKPEHSLKEKRKLKKEEEGPSQAHLMPGARQSIFDFMIDPTGMRNFPLGTHPRS
jgi:hypothetical protein